MSKTHTIMNLIAEENRKDFIGVHAEFEACRGLRPYDIGNRAKLYVFRKLRSGGQGLAKPCAACMKLIEHLGIRRVYYSLNNEGFSTMRV